VRITNGSIGTVTIDSVIDANDIPGDTFQSVAPITAANTATLAVAAGAGNKAVMLKAAAANGEDVFIGDSGITNPGVTEDGIPLAAGEAMVINTTAAVYAISASGGQKLYVSRVYKA
jgi:hypothetical protein|tara:strand:- start:278 stop:628 length:351 start_codon:yes stop_codon:yes gene_type:complete